MRDGDGRLPLTIRSPDAAAAAAVSTSRHVATHATRAEAGSCPRARPPAARGAGHVPAGSVCAARSLPLAVRTPAPGVLLLLEKPGLCGPVRVPHVTVPTILDVHLTALSVIRFRPMHGLQYCASAPYSNLCTTVAKLLLSGLQYYPRPCLDVKRFWI